MPRKRLEDYIGSTINNRLVVGVVRWANGKGQLVVQCHCGHRAKGFRSGLARKGCRKCYLRERHQESEDRLRKLLGKVLNGRRVVGYSTVSSKIQLECKNGHCVWYTPEQASQHDCNLCVPSQEYVGRTFNGRVVVKAFGDGTLLLRCKAGHEAVCPLNSVERRRCIKCQSEWNVKHGALSHGKRPPEYGVWCRMRSRCQNPNDPIFRYYGGRGIRVCDRWQEFNQFLEDIEPRPTPNHTIERNNNDGDYTPENCRWATRKEQNLNTRRTVLIPYKGKMVPACLVADDLGINRSTFTRRLKQWGDVERAINQPVRQRGARPVQRIGARDDVH